MRGDTMRLWMHKELEVWESLREENLPKDHLWNLEVSTLRKHPHIKVATLRDQSLAVQCQIMQEVQQVLSIYKARRILRTYKGTLHR